MNSKLSMIDEYADKDLVKRWLEQIQKEIIPGKIYRLMEFCGGHTHALFSYGIKTLLPQEIQMIHGPGCPVCVLPKGRIDSVVDLLTRHPEITLFTYADLMRVPGSGNKTFIKLKAEGFGIQMTYSPFDAVKFAELNPQKTIVFLAIGFETTAPATALAIQMAQDKKLNNFSAYCLHLLTPPAVQHVIDGDDLSEEEQILIDGFIGPGHVSAVIGSSAFARFAHDYNKPVVISGFSPVDMLQSILFLIQMINKKEGRLQNEYVRSVNSEGNKKALELMNDVFETREIFDWRGLGQVPNSALKISNKYSHYDAEARFQINNIQSKDHLACLCGSIIRGLKQPKDCQLFGKACTPDHPIGSCMVSSEGSCSAYYLYDSF